MDYFEITKSDMCFSYRDDILFRSYVLTHNDKKAWEWFSGLKANRKVNRKLLYKIHESIKKNGQKKR